MFELWKKASRKEAEAQGALAGFCRFFEVEDCSSMKEERVDSFLSCFGGRSFGNGVFRTFAPEDIDKWHKITNCDMYSKLHGEYELFGYDWSGRCFAVSRNKKLGYNEVIILELCTCKILFTEVGFLDFLNSEIPQYHDACLDSEYYKEWLVGHEPVELMQCVGYKVPLFLNGQDEVDNKEIIDMEVYWDMTTQIWEAVKDLPEGTKIGDIRFE
ncbi:hypothetical protein [uncultured Adlercreutzia sp.]|uniref:hypothetical protein n=1 Tax=uncultured Adlercreutzia sp. TaxID=875803 RepID=UPI0026F4092B|nr:hypothetical protein [uncultured Adlercreutzia sp.]